MFRFGLKIDIDPIKKIEGLKQALQNKIVRKAIQTAGKPILQAAKGSVPQRIGALKFSLALKVKTKKNVSFGLIGPKSHYTKAKQGIMARPSRYAHIVHNKFRPFLKNAFNPAKVKEEIADLIAAGIKAELNT